MNKRRIFDIRSAYGQLILLVFLPICFLSAVGSYLIYKEVTQANINEQNLVAQSILLRYQPLIEEELSDVINNPNSDDNNPVQTKKQEIQLLLQRLIGDNNQHSELRRIAVIDSNKNIIASSGVSANQAWSIPASVNLNNSSSNPTNIFTIPITSDFGNLHGIYLPIKSVKAINSDISYWLFIDIDNHPFRVIQYRILLTLSVTVLLTILLLLISLGSYARRWIAPIYEMRLHLQGTNENNLYKPIPVKTEGELNLLQQDLLLTLRRLHTSFQDLKSHSEQTEDDLRKAFDEMEMQNISIRNSRDKALTSSQSKSDFLANISHELRTPLNSIDGFINLLARNGSLSAEQDLYVQTIRKSSAHLLALVNDVLDFSKIEAGKLVLDSHDFDIYNTIYDVADMLSPLACEKDLRMGVVFYNDVPRNIHGDELRMKQVLTNLVANAIKFTNIGDIKITVKLDEDKENFLIISVQDSGKGVSEQGQKLLFKSFSQADPSITREYGGTGLGLVISKQLTKMMGGSIGYYDNQKENIASHGSTFWYRIPANVDVLEDENIGDIKLPTLFKNPQNNDFNRPLNILLWMSHPVSVQVLKTSLKPLNINITETNSLASTLNKLKETANNWDWVIVDSESNETKDDMTALLKQIRLHYQRKLCVFGYQVMLDTQLLTKYHAQALHEPIDKRQLYAMLDTKTVTNNKPVNDNLKWQGYRVLAVDDHQPNLLVLQALLTEQGIEVVTANSGFDAIDIISKQLDINNPTRKPIDLIFMDIQMPRMSGHEASQQIRTISKQANRIPIIALTAHGMADERDKLIASGMDGYVGKPISQPQLLQILQKWLGRNNEISELVDVSSINTKNQQLDYGVQSLQTEPASVFIQALPLVQQHDVLQQLQEHTLQFNVISTKNNQTKVYLRYTPLNLTQLSKKYNQTTSKPLINPIIDWQDALTRSANKENLAAQLILMMIDSIDSEKQQLELAWQSNNRELLAQISHRILGASRYAGVPQLREASQLLEDKCLMNVNNNSFSQMSMLQPFYDNLLTALNNLSTVDLSTWPQLQQHQLKEDEMTWKMI